MADTWERIGLKVEEVVIGSQLWLPNPVETVFWLTDLRHVADTSMWFSRKPNSQFFRPEILRNPPKQLMWFGASRRLSSGALRTEAPGRCTLRLRKATWRWSRRCSPRAPSSRRRFATAAALRDGTDVTGRTWWEGGAADFRMKFDGVRHLNVTGHWVCCQFWELRSRNLQCTLRDSVLRMSTTSRQQMQVSVAGCCGYVTLDIMTRSGSGGWVKLRRHFAGLVLLIMADGCKLILMISCLDCSVFLWIFDLVCSVWHGRGVTSQYFPISWSWFR